MEFEYRKAFPTIGAQASPARYLLLGRSLSRVLWGTAVGDSYATGARASSTCASSLSKFDFFLCSSARAIARSGRVLTGLSTVSAVPGAEIRWVRIVTAEATAGASEKTARASPWQSASVPDTVYIMVYEAADEHLP